MADKKDLVDYLRNLQKRAEIEAKTNGINIWVLLGALTLLAWQMLSPSQAPWWDQPEALLHGIVVAQMVYYLLRFDYSGSDIGDDVRLAQGYGFEARPFMHIIQTCILLFPSLALLMLKVWSFASVSLAALYLLILFGEIMGLGAVFMSWKQKKTRFPKPRLAPSPKVQRLIAIIMTCWCVWVAVAEFQVLIDYIPGIRLEVLRGFVVAFAFYWLLVVLVEKIIRLSNLSWTYEVETGLLLGLMTPDQAMQRIENKVIGPRFSGLMDEFFAELDSRHLSIKNDLANLESKVAEISEIPKEYTRERASRSVAASANARASIDALLEGHEEYQKFTKAFLLPQLGMVHPMLFRTIESINTRHAKYFQESKELSEQYEKIMKPLG